MKMVNESKMSSLLIKTLLIVGSLGMAAIIWQLVAHFIVRDPFILPSFFDVALSFNELWKEIPGDISVSLLHFGMGLIAGICVGVPIGTLMGWFRVADRILDPLVEIIRPIPPLSWIPFAIIWFGLAHSSAGFIVFIGAVFPILINTYTGFRGVRKIYVEAAKVLGCIKNFDLIKSIAFPSATPSIATGIRVGMGIGWMCLVAAEIFGQTSGLGYKLWWFYSLHQMDKVVAYMIVLGLIGLLLDRVFRYFIEEQMLRWRKGITL